MKKARLKELGSRLTGEEFDWLYDRAIERMRADPEKRKMLEALELFESLSAIGQAKKKKTVKPSEARA